MSISQSLPTTDPAFRLNFQGARRLDPRMAFTRSSTATYIDEDGIIKTAAANTSRFAYDPATGESLGLLIEEARTNYLFYSNMLQGWAFGAPGDAFTASSGSQLSTNPDGSSPAYHYVPSTNAGRHRYNRIVTVPTLNTNYVVSLFVKRVTAGNVSNLNRYIELEVTGAFNGNTPGTGHTGSVGGSDVTFDLQTLTIEPNTEKYNGYVGGAKIEQYPDGWYRLSYIFNPGIGSNFTGTVWWGHPNVLGEDTGNEVGNGSPSFYFWGAQVELGTYPTSYILTPSESAITRSADIATFTSQEISTTGTLLSLGGGSTTSPASYNSSEVDTSPLLSNPVITLNSQLSDSSTIPTLLYYPEPISGEAIRAMRAYAPIVKSGLVLHLDAGVDKSYPNSGTTWWDLSGQGNNGQVNGAGYNDINGGSLTFDGTDDTVSIPGGGSLNISTTLTATVWVYYISGNGRIFQKDGPPYTRCWEIGGYGGQFRMEMWHSNGAATIGYGNALTVNGWTHLALTFDGTDIKMYQNSLLVSTINFPGDIRTDANTPIFLGGYWDGEFLNGRISNAQLYNRALTSAEILQNFNASRSRFNI